MKSQVILIKPTIEWKKEIINYRKEFLLETKAIAGSNNLASFEKVSDWLTYLSLNEKWDTLPNRDFVPSIQYMLVNQMDKKILGMSNLRLELSDYLLKVGGHIGYSVALSEQSKGYGKLLLKETLEKAKELNINKILVTCSDDNIASAKVIESQQGTLENIIFVKSVQSDVRRYWIDNQ